MHTNFFKLFAKKKVEKEWYKMTTKIWYWLKNVKLELDWDK